jgi:RNA polymerase sigma-70 factor (sigma-E family)
MATVTASRLDLDALYAAQWHAMVRLAVLLVDDRAAAEDVVQDAFVAMYRKPPRDEAAAVGYLRTSVLNGARGVLRRRGVARKYLPGQFARPSSDGPDDLLAAAAEHADVVAALRKLPNRQREVLVLRYWSHLSEAEIANTLGISVGTVKSTASRGLDALEATLGGSK